MESRLPLDVRAATEEDSPARDDIRAGRNYLPSSDAPHLFLFPGMGGHDPNLVEIGIACKDLVQTLQISYPHWRALLHNPDFDLDALVSDAIAQIALHRATGPILLAGYSFGGIVAFAVAMRLRDAGREVCFVGLLDIESQPGIDISPGALRYPKTRRRELAGFIAAARRGEGASKLAYALARRLKSPRWEPLLRLYAQVRLDWLPGEFTVYLDRDLLSQHMEPLLREWAMMRETLPPLHAPVFLFRTAQHSANAPRHLGWDHCCPNLTVISMSGTHRGMLGSSNLPALCTAFRNAVAQVLGRPSSNAGGPLG